MLTGSQIRKIRKSMGITQADLSKRMCFDRGLISQYELGKRRCRRIFSLALLYLANEKRRRSIRTQYARQRRYERAIILSETLTPTVEASQAWQYIDDNDGSRSR
jgi:transcriptional regulator with XRE-family HTH domain